MKKLLLSAIICSMVIGLAGCDTDGGASEPSATDSSVSSSTVSLSESDPILSAAETSDTDSATDYRNWRGIMVYRPENFKGEDVFATDICSGNISTDDKVYCYLNCSATYSAEHDPSTYTEDDVPEIFSNLVYQVVDNFFPSYREEYKVTVDTEKKVDVLGTTFLRRTGTIHTDDPLEKKSADLYYAVYYGVTNLPGTFVTDAPVVWMTFAECTDEKTKEDVEFFADTMAENATFNEEDLKTAQEYWSEKENSSEESSAVSSDSSVDTE